MFCLSVWEKHNNNKHTKAREERWKDERRTTRERGNGSRSSSKSGAPFESPVAAEKALSIPLRLERELGRLVCLRRPLALDSPGLHHDEWQVARGKWQFRSCRWPIVSGRGRTAPATLQPNLSSLARPKRSHAHSRCSFVPSCDSAPSAHVSRGAGRRSLRGENDPIQPGRPESGRANQDDERTWEEEHTQTGTRQSRHLLKCFLLSTTQPAQPNPTNIKPIPHHGS